MEQMDLLFREQSMQTASISLLSEQMELQVLVAVAAAVVDLEV